MTITIRKASEEDFVNIFSLIEELATYVKEEEKITNSVELMKKEKDFFECLVAENEEKEIIGMASYFFAYYTWVGKSLYLDDLYVKESYRGRKTGTMLLKKLFEIAKQMNCKRVRWQTKKWNKPAIDFYKKLGADIADNSLNCDFNLKRIQEFKI